MPLSDAVRHPIAMRILAVMAASAIVAAGASGVGLLAPGARLEGAWPWLVRLGGAVAAGCGLAVLLHGRKRSPRVARSDPAVAALVTAGTIMGVLTVLALLAPRAATVDPVAEQLAIQQAVEESESDPRRPGEFRPDEPDRGSGFRATGEDESGGGLRYGSAVQRNLFLGPPDPHSAGRRFPLLLLGILLALGAIIGMIVLRRRLRVADGDAVDEMPVSAEEAEAGLASSLEEVSYDGPDPRRQITAAYHRLLAALAEAGAPREPQEAPHEHLHRALGPLGVPAAPMHGLAELYVVAQFSTRTLTEAHRAAAAECVGSALASLREAHPSARTLNDVPRSAA